MTHRALTLALLCCLPACDTESSSDDGGGGEADAAGGLCEALDCNGHGTCRLDAEGLPYCDCDDGYAAQGLDCVAEDAAPEPPADFTCPAPGDVGEPLFQKLAANPWYYTANDRTCRISGSQTIWTFRPDGVFFIKFQFQPTPQTMGGLVDYGCYTFVVDSAEATGTVEQITLNYDYANDSSHNCLALASGDPPCSGKLEAYGETDLVVPYDPEVYHEVHVFRPVTDPECVWCNSKATCCPEPSWIEDGDGPICQ